MDHTRPTHPRRAALLALSLLLGAFAAIAALVTKEGHRRGERHAGARHEHPPASLGECVPLGKVENGRLLGFSPDGGTLAVATDGGWTSAGPIRLWDVRSGTETGSVGEAWGELETVRFSPDGTLIAAHDKRRGMGVWDVKTAAMRDAFRPHTIYGNAVSFWFSPDGKSLVYRHYGEKFPHKDDSLLNIRDVGAGRDRASVVGEPWLFAFSPDGSRLATGTTSPRGKRDRVMLWAWSAGKAPVLLRDHRVSADAIAFSPDLSRYATATASAGDRGESEIRVADMDTGRTRLAFTHTDTETHIQEISFGPAGNLLIANGGGGSQLAWTTRSEVWDVAGLAARKIGSYPTEPAASPDGRLLAVREESRVTLTEVATGRARGDLTRPGDGASSAVFGSFSRHRSYPSVTFSPDGRLAVAWRLYNTAPGGGPRIARVWRVEPLTELRTLESCQDLEFSPDGRALAVLTSDGALNLYRIH